MPNQFVTLVTTGGTPIRLSDQTGAPYATTGTGPLVFANGAALVNPTFTGPIFIDPFGFARGTVTAPTIFFEGDEDTGVYSPGAGQVAITSDGVQAIRWSGTSTYLVGAIAQGSWQGTAVAAAYGGTGLSTYAVGDILYASTTTALSRLADVATGNALISGGVGTAPSWGKIELDTHVSGNLPVGNLDSGTSASGTTFWCGDGTWKTPTVPAADIEIGVTTVTGGTDTRILYDNAGVVGQYAISGTGSVAMTNSPALVTPALGVATATSLAIGGAVLGGNALAVTGTSVFNSAVTMSAALSYGGVTLTNAVVGTGSMVLAVSPTLVTPVLGVATATSINKVAITTPATGSTLTIADGKILTVSNTLTFLGTDGSSLNVGAGGTLGSAAYQNTGTSGGNVPLLTGVNTWSGAQTFSAAITYGGVTLSNAVTGTGSMVLSSSPALTTPNLGTPSAGILTNCTGLPPTGLTGDLANQVDHTSWTPSDQSGAALAFTNVTANYTRVGNMVYAYFSLKYPATANGSATLISLPVAVPNNNYANVAFQMQNDGGSIGMYGVMIKNSSTFGLWSNTASGHFTNAQVSGLTISGMAIYPAV